MSASIAVRRRVLAMEGVMEARTLNEQVTRIDEAIDLRRARAAQLLGEAVRELATIDRLDRLKDQAGAKLGTTLHDVTGLIDGIPLA